MKKRVKHELFHKGAFRLPLFLIAGFALTGLVLLSTIFASAEVEVGVRMRGQVGGENAVLQIKGVPVKTWELTRNFITYEHIHSSSIDNTDIEVVFTNDSYRPGRDLNVQIDYITVNDDIFQTEDDSVNRIYDRENRWCRSGHQNSEWLYCNGRMRYSIGDSGYISEPDEPSTLIQVAASGESGEERIELRIGNDAVATWDLSKAERVFEYAHPGEVSISDVSVAYINNGTSSTGGEKTAIIDYVAVDGTRYQSEAATTYSTGTWSSDTGCLPGYKESEQLHCGGYFRYADDGDGLVGRPGPSIPRPIPDIPDAGSPSGEELPVGDLVGWRQIFTDDFTTDVALGDFPDAVSDKWGAYPYTWRDTKGQQNTDATRGGWYHPERVVSIHDGVMDKWLHTEVIDGEAKRLVAAVQPKLFGGDAFDGQLYGRYAIRFKADPGLRGYKVAWLLWPDSETWPRDGELDFPEGDLDSRIEGYMHWQGGTTGSSQWYAHSEEAFTEWHTAVIEWEPGRVAYYLDGELIRDASYGDSDWDEEPAKIPNTPMHYVIQTETTLNDIVPDVLTEGHVLIDWVAVWAYDP